MHHHPLPQQFHPLLLPDPAHVLVRHAAVLEVQPDHVRLHGPRHAPAEMQPDALDELGAPVRLAQAAAFAVGSRAEGFLHGDSGRGRDDAGLADAAADALADPAAAVDRGRVADDDGADGRGEPFAEAELRRVEAREVVWQRAGAGGDGFPDPCAVEVHVDVVRTGEGGDGPAFREGRYDAADRVFDHDHARRRGVDVAAQRHGAADVGQRQVEPVGGGDAEDLGLGEDGTAPGFVEQDTKGRVSGREGRNNGG